VIISFWDGLTLGDETLLMFCRSLDVLRFLSSRSPAEVNGPAEIQAKLILPYTTAMSASMAILLEDGAVSSRSRMSAVGRDSRRDFRTGLVRRDAHDASSPGAFSVLLVFLQSSALLPDRSASRDEDVTQIAKGVSTGSNYSADAQDPGEAVGIDPPTQNQS
jgi:hypothetical protein